MKRCPKCGAENHDGYRFCSTCGGLLEQTPLQQQFPVTFRRPGSLSMIANAFHFRVDQTLEYELKNGAQIEIPLTPGSHKIEITVFGYVRRKSFTLHVTEPMELICEPAPAAIVSVMAVPVKVRDQRGRIF